eukprot:PhF_6_TR38147/c0_g1_i3/m.56981
MKSILIQSVVITVFIVQGLVIAILIAAYYNDESHNPRSPAHIASAETTTTSTSSGGIVHIAEEGVPPQLFLFGGSGAVGHQVLAALAVVVMKTPPIAASMIPNVTVVLRGTRHKARLPDLYANVKGIHFVENVSNMTTFMEREALQWLPSKTVKITIVWALGSTYKKAGSAEAFTYSDQVLPLSVAGVLRAQDRHRSVHWIQVSAVNAQSDSWFLYPRVKGVTDDQLANHFGFAAFDSVRPSLLLGSNREVVGDDRPMEKLLMSMWDAHYVRSLVKTLFPSKHWAIKVSDVGRACAALALYGPGN